MLNPPIKHNLNHSPTPSFPYRSTTQSHSPTPSQPYPQALIALYHATDGQHWNRSSNWLAGDPCSADRPWYGVSCARVTERTLPGGGGGGVYMLRTGGVSYVYMAEGVTLMIVVPSMRVR